MEFKFQVQTKVRKPVREVFDAVYNPRKLEKYFTTKSASAQLDEGTTVMWEFADHPGAFPVRVKKVVPEKLISFGWEAGDGPYDTLVEMRFEPLDESSTLVTIAESGWKQTDEGLEHSYRNCQGWMQMSCCLKAYLEYGINLREGFF
jgi:uncharacterized protein YndB with AHSA1/START domain